jgi:hypothetical protein
MEDQPTLPSMNSVGIVYFGFLTGEPSCPGFPPRDEDISTAERLAWMRHLGEVELDMSIFHGKLKDILQ